MSQKYLVFILCLTLNACAITTTRFTSESEANVRSVGIDQNIKIPERAVFLGPTGLTDTMHGPSDWRSPDYALEERKRITREKFRALIAEAEVARKGGIDKYMKNNQIDIGDIVLQEFEKQVRQHPKESIGSDSIDLVSAIFEEVDHSSYFCFYINRV